jgi:hypothetical protein
VGQAFAQIKSYGAATGSARTPEQTDVALFWSANGSAKKT